MLLHLIFIYKFNSLSLVNTIMIISKYIIRAFLLFWLLLYQPIAFSLGPIPAIQYWTYSCGCTDLGYEWSAKEEACVEETNIRYGSKYTGVLESYNSNGGGWNCSIYRSDGSVAGGNYILENYKCPAFYHRDDTVAPPICWPDPAYYIYLIDMEDETTALGNPQKMCLVGHPINPVTGNKVLNENLVIREGVDSLAFSLTYNSKSPYPANMALLGNRRNHSYSQSMSVQVEKRGKVNIGPTRSAESSACSSGWLDLRPDYLSRYPWLADSQGIPLNETTCQIVYNGGKKVWKNAVIAHISETPSVPEFKYATVVRADGRKVIFKQMGNEWVNQSNTGERIEEIFDNTGRLISYHFATLDDKKEIYDLEGKLHQIKSINNTAQTLAYDGDSGLLGTVTNSTGNAISFIYDLNNRIERISDDTGRSWIFNYDNNNNLSSIINPDFTQRIYHYEDVRFISALTGVTDESNIRYSQYAYNEQENAVLSTLANDVERIDLVYNSDGTRNITNSRGISSVYQTAINDGIPLITQITGPGCTTCGQGDTKYTYDLANNNLLTKFEKGMLTEYGGYNLHGNPGYKIEAAGTPQQYRTDYYYHPEFSNKLLKIIEPSVKASDPTVKCSLGIDCRIASYTYDEFGNRTSVTIEGYTPDRADGYVQVSRTTDYKYEGPLNQLSEIDGSRVNTDVGDITQLIYYPNEIAQGNNRARLKQLIGPEGIIFRDDIQYTASGKVLSEKRPNGITLSVTYYPGNDHLETITEHYGTKSRVTKWTYLATGEVETITQADGTTLASTLRFEYDVVRRLTGITDNQGNKVEFILDSEGNQVQRNVKDRDEVLHRTLKQTFDVYNRLDAQILINDIIDFNYAKDGTLQDQTDAKTNKTAYSYDALNRLTAITSDVGGVDTSTQDSLTEYFYDVADRLTQVITPNSVTTQYVYDDLGNLLKEESPDRGTRIYTYDEAGNVKTISDAGNITVIYNYDGLNRVTHIDYPGVEEDVYLIYDTCTKGVGRLCQVVDASGTTDYSYSDFGNITDQEKTEASITYTTHYDYDILDRVVQITTPTGRVVNYGYDSANRTADIDAEINGLPQTIAHDALYRAGGLLTSLTLGNGFIDQRLYNLKGQLTTQLLPLNSSSPNLSNAPIANAGRDQQVKESETVMLDGAHSIARQGFITSYYWTQTEGRPVQLVSSKNAQISFTAPYLKKNEYLTFQLLVTDDQGRQATDSITVSVENVASVFWTSLKKAIADGGTLTKTGPNKTWDAGAISLDKIPADGAVEFTAVTTNSYRAVGLSYENLSVKYDTIDYAIYLRDDTLLYVHESGSWHGPFGNYLSGDVFRVERIGDIVDYKRNGTTFYTSTKLSSGELIVDASIYSPYSQITEAKVYGRFYDDQAPLITNVESNLFSGSATIQWSTDEKATSQISYGITSADELNTPLDEVLKTTHNVALSGLQENTVYQYLIKSRDVWGNVATSPVFTFTTGEATVEGIPVVWTDLIKTTANAGTLTKSGSVKTWDAGAASVDYISTDGGVEFTAMTNNAYRAVGLSYINTSVDYKTIEYVIYLRDDALVYVNESGTWHGPFSNSSFGVQNPVFPNKFTRYLNSISNVNTSS